MKSNNPLSTQKGATSKTQDKTNKPPILWRRKLSCGHYRDTNLAYMASIYEKPNVGDVAYCRECCADTIILEVSEAPERDRMGAEKFQALYKYNKREDSGKEESMTLWCKTNGCIYQVEQMADGHWRHIIPFNDMIDLPQPCGRSLPKNRRKA